MIEAIRRLIASPAWLLRVRCGAEQARAYLPVDTPITLKAPSFSW